MDKRSSRDFLSDLPLSIVHMILALVPIRDVVRTSILSRKWRYKWASLPELVFDDECAKPSQDLVGLVRFIHQTLFLHEGPIQKFQLDVKNMVRCSYTDQWLLNLSRNDIRELILNIEDYEGSCFEVHSSLYLCQNLTNLELFRCIIPPPPPTFEGFSHLRRLVLHHVDVNGKMFYEMPPDMIEDLVASCPLLEELTLRGLFQLRVEHLKLCFHAPNLKRFRFKGTCDKMCLYAPLLANLTVSFAPTCRNSSRDERLQQKSPLCNYTDFLRFLGGFTNLEELSVDLFYMKYSSVDIESCQRSLVFHHLRLIEFRDMRYVMEHNSVFFHLIAASPNLHKLGISSYDFIFFPNVARDPDFAPKFTFERLKVIEMKHVCGELHEMRFIKFLLESSPVLETMIFKPKLNRTDTGLLILATELLRFHRASTNCEIVFNTSRKPSRLSMDDRWL